MPQLPGLRPLDLRCESHVNPLGLTERAPRVSWKLDPQGAVLQQHAYQIQLASGPDGAEKLGADSPTWDSGKVTSGDSVLVGLPDFTPSSRTRTTWRVRVWGSEDIVSEWSETAFWEMGLLQPADWSAGWIQSPVAGSPYSIPAAPYLRKEFTLPSPPKSARLFITALGIYEAELNGSRIGDLIFPPGWTDYKTRVQVQSYDVTDLIRPGANVLGAVLGDGWYCGHIGWTQRQVYGDRPRLLAQLEITCEDGSRLTVGTDPSWKTSTGPLLGADLLMGADYDARLDLGAWSQPGFDDSAWQRVQTFADPGCLRVGSDSPPVRAQEILACKLLNPSSATKGQLRLRYDFGQNLVGRLRIRVRGQSGATIKIIHGEMLDEQGAVYTENLRSARATDYYTLKGSGEESFEPPFTFHGFRYAELFSADLTKAEVLAVEAVVLGSELESTGQFSCSNPLLNQLQHNIQWGQKGNFLEVPTDCPQRDERLGWTGDAQVFVRTASFNFDVRGFFTKWIQDLRDAQTDKGAVPPVIPFFGGLMEDSGPAWADAAIICPWVIFQQYGDRRILERHLDSLRAYLGQLQESSLNDIRSHPDTGAWGGFGDWLALDGALNNEGSTRKDLIGTAFFAHCAKLMADILKEFGLDEEAATYRKLRQTVVEAFTNRFVTPDGLVVGATQTSYVLALHFDLLPAGVRPAAANELVRDIRNRDYHLSTGFVGTPYLLHVLHDTGHTDVAFKLLEQETFPSWLFPVLNGATTIWERWNGWTTKDGFGDKRMNSFNHYAYGAVGDWMTSVVAGLDYASPGGRSIRFKPTPGGTITQASASLETPYGRAAITWSLNGDKLDANVTVPPNTTATFIPPKGFRLTTKAPEPLPPGTHTIACVKDQQ